MALVSLAAACSDAFAPRPLAANLSAAVAGAGSASLSRSDTLHVTISIDPWHTTAYSLGAGNTLTVPAGAVCDPAKSSDGDNEWGNPCAPATAAVTEDVGAWLDATGHPRVEFSNSLRFVPSADPAGWVLLTLHDRSASLDSLYGILYCRTARAACADEAAKDQTLLTVRDPRSGNLTRRIQHLSGYRVGAIGRGAAANAVRVKRTPR